MQIKFWENQNLWPQMGLENKCYQIKRHWGSSILHFYSLLAKTLSRRSLTQTLPVHRIEDTNDSITLSESIAQPPRCLTPKSVRVANNRTNAATQKIRVPRVAGAQSSNSPNVS